MGGRRCGPCRRSCRRRPAMGHPSVGGIVDPDRKGKRISKRRSHNETIILPRCWWCPTARAAPDACSSFKFQVQPLLLHMLDVNGYATVVGGREKKDNDNGVIDLINSGGMNWGSRAVYSCLLSCNDNQEEFVIVQKAVGNAPMRKNVEKGDDSDGDD